MIVTVAREMRVEATADGRAWATIDPAAYWEEYLDTFSSVHVLCRARQVPAPSPGSREITAPNVDVVPLPDYRGPFGFLRVAREVRRRVRDVAREDGAFVVRLPGMVGGLLAARLRRLGKPYGVEVVGDPAEVFRPPGPGGVLRPLFRWWFTAQQRRACATAAVIAHRSRELQERYPARNADQFAYTAVEIDFTRPPRSHRPLTADDPVEVITVGSLEQRYKRVDVVLRALASCRRRGYDLRLTVVGDGRYRTTFQKLAARLELAEVVRFAGAVAGPAAVRDLLDRADVFVLASDTEGLARSAIEAMAAGLPCILTDAGGSRELVAPQDLVRPDDADGLAAALTAVIDNPDRQAAMITRNLERAACFRPEILGRARRSFRESLLRSCASAS